MSHPIQTNILILAAILVVAAVSLVLLFLFGSRRGAHRSALAHQLLGLGFQPIEYDSQIERTLKSLSLGTDGPSLQGTLYHADRREAHFYLLPGSMMSASNLPAYQNSMLVTSPELGLPRMVTLPHMKTIGLLGRFVDEILDRIPMGSLQLVELQSGEAFRLFAESPMQALAFFDSWRLAQLGELSRAYVSCRGDAFICSLIETDLQRSRTLTASAGLHQLFAIAQGLYAGFTN